MDEPKVTASREGFLKMLKLCDEAIAAVKAKFGEDEAVLNPLRRSRASIERGLENFERRESHLKQISETIGADGTKKAVDVLHKLLNHKDLPAGARVAVANNLFRLCASSDEHFEHMSDEFFENLSDEDVEELITQLRYTIKDKHH